MQDKKTDNNNNNKQVHNLSATTTKTKRRQSLVSVNQGCKYMVGQTLEEKRESAPEKLKTLSKKYRSDISGLSKIEGVVTGLSMGARLGLNAWAASLQTRLTNELEKCASGEQDISSSINNIASQLFGEAIGCAIITLGAEGVSYICRKRISKITNNYEEECKNIENLFGADLKKEFDDALQQDAQIRYKTLKEIDDKEENKPFGMGNITTVLKAVDKFKKGGDKQHQEQSDKQEQEQERGNLIEALNKLEKWQNYTGAISSGITTISSTIVGVDAGYKMMGEFECVLDGEVLRAALESEKSNKVLNDIAGFLASYGIYASIAIEMGKVIIYTSTLMKREKLKTLKLSQKHNEIISAGQNLQMQTDMMKQQVKDNQSILNYVRKSQQSPSKKNQIGKLNPNQGNRLNSLQHNNTRKFNLNENQIIKSNPNQENRPSSLGNNPASHDYLQIMKTHEIASLKGLQNQYEKANYQDIIWCLVDEKDEVLYQPPKPLRTLSSLVDVVETALDLICDPKIDYYKGFSIKYGDPPARENIKVKITGYQM